MLATKKKAQLIANKFMERHQQGTPYLTKMVRQALIGHCDLSSEYGNQCQVPQVGIEPTQPSLQN